MPVDVTFAKINNYSGPFPLGKYKIAHVNLTMSGAYDSSKVPVFPDDHPDQTDLRDILGWDELIRAIPHNIRRNGTSPNHRNTIGLSQGTANTARFLLNQLDITNGDQTELTNEGVGVLDFDMTVIGR